MCISTGQIGLITIITPQCPLVLENMDKLKQKIQPYLEGRDQKLIFDFIKVSHIDSRGLEYLLDSFEEVTRDGGGIKLCNVNPLCNDILLATRMAAFFEMYKDGDEAAKSYV